MQHKLDEDRVQCEQRGNSNGRGPEQRRSANGHNGKGEDAIGSKFQQSQEIVFASAGVPLRALDGHADLPETHPAPHPAQIAVMFGHPLDLLHHSARHQTEISRIERKPKLRKSCHHAVENEIAEPERPRLLPIRALGIYHVVALEKSSNELRNDLRHILQIAVHDDRGVSADVVERGSQRRLMTEVARERHHDDARIFPRHLFQNRHRAVHASVVHKEKLVRPARYLVQHDSRAPHQLRERSLFVVNGNRHRETKSGLQGFALPLQYTIFQRVAVAAFRA